MMAFLFGYYIAFAYWIPNLEAILAGIPYAGTHGSDQGTANEQANR